MPRYQSPWMDSDLDAGRELSRTFFEKEAQSNIAKFAEQHRVDRDAWNRAGERGLLCVSTPEKYGGSGELTHRNPPAGTRPPGTDHASGEFAPSTATGTHA